MVHLYHMECDAVERGEKALCCFSIRHWHLMPGYLNCNNMASLCEVISSNGCILYLNCLQRMQVLNDVAHDKLIHASIHSPRDCLAIQITDGTLVMYSSGSFL